MTVIQTRNYKSKQKDEINPTGNATALQQRCKETMTNNVRLKHGHKHTG